MSEADLAEIRKARLAQLQQESSGSNSSSGAGKLAGGSGGGGGDEQKEQEAEARATILSQILFPEALDRLGRIRLVKESRATDVENRLIMLARTGQIRAKVTEEQLKELLGAVAEKEDKAGGGKIIVTSRRKGYGLGDDEDDEW